MNCRICDNASSNSFYDVREMVFGSRERFRYMQCSKCLCLQIVQVPSDMSRFYPPSYYSHKPLPMPGKLRRFLRNARNRSEMFNDSLFGKALSGISPAMTLRCISKTAPARDARILDVGCGSGSLLFQLRELGFANLLGTDPLLDREIRYGNGLAILDTNFQDIGNRWDLVMFHHSFEHLPDPVRALRHVREILDDNGRCIIRVPTVSSFAWTHYGVDWVQLDAPRHFHLHSIESLKMAAEQAGLRVYDSEYDSTFFQFWGSEQYRKDIPLNDPRSYGVDRSTPVFSKEELRTYRNKARELNALRQGDQAVFYLQKQPRAEEPLRGQSG